MATNRYHQQDPLFEVCSHTGMVLSVVRAATKAIALQVALNREELMLTKKYDAPRDITRGMKMFRGAYALLKQ